MSDSISRFARLQSNFQKLYQRYEKSGGGIDVREVFVLTKKAGELSLAAQALPPAQQALLAARRNDAFEQRTGTSDASALVDRTGGRWLPDPAGGRRTFTNSPQDKNAAARQGAGASWHQDVSAAIQRALDRGFHPIAEGSGSLEQGDAYHAAVVDELRKQGYRAFFDGEEIQLKRPGADHSESYDISTWQGQVRDFYASWSSPPTFD